LFRRGTARNAAEGGMTGSLPSLTFGKGDNGGGDAFFVNSIISWVLNTLVTGLHRKNELLSKTTKIMPL